MTSDGSKGSILPDIRWERISDHSVGAANVKTSGAEGKFVRSSKLFER